MPEATSRVSLSTGELQDTYVTGLSQISVAYGEGAAWILNYGHSTVTRIDPGDGAMTHFDVGHQAADVTTGFRSVWVLSTRENSVWRLNPPTGRPQAIVPVGDYPWEVATGAGSVWVTNDQEGTVSRIDPETDRVVATIETGFLPPSRPGGRRGRRVGGGLARDHSRVEGSIVYLAPLPRGPAAGLPQGARGSQQGARLPVRPRLMGPHGLPLPWP
jgi:YVTN family beta-propeller protein